MNPRSISCLAVAMTLLVTAEVHARSYILVAEELALPVNLETSVLAAGGTVTLFLPQIGVAVVESDRDEFAPAAGAIIGIGSVLPDVTVQGAEPFYEASEAVADGELVADAVSLVITDPRFPIQWGLAAINAPGAWAAGHFGAGVRVAVLDSGIASSHIDLAASVNNVLSRSFVPGEAYNYTYAGPGTTTFNHGTHVAGIIASRMNNAGGVGVAPQAEIVAVKVVRTKTGSGSLSWVMAGIVYAADIEADVINMSLGALFPRRGYLVDVNHTPGNPADDIKIGADQVSEMVTALGRATNYAHQRGTTIIASAGNSALDRDHDADMWATPADIPHVIAVAATAPFGWAKNPAGTFLDNPAHYSNYGQSRIDFAAPGGDSLYTPKDEFSTIGTATAKTYVFDMVYSPSNRYLAADGKTYTVWSWASGTSMAAPHVSGVAALIIGKNGGRMAPAAVEAALRASADDLGKPGKDDFYGHGRVNAARAVQ
ncbi:MAG: S8 family serine peptidase [Opitutaceae bacterium]|nr:S8 family serine peptidase [Opitutaceae bacterium]